MIGDLSTYNIKHFIMFSYEVYWAMVANYNKTLWPFQILLFLSNGALFYFVLKKQKIKFVLAVLAFYHVLISFVFFRQNFATINTASTYISWVYILLSGLLLFLLFKNTSWKAGGSKFFVGLIAVGLFVPFHFFRNFDFSHMMLAGWGSLNTSLLTIGVILSLASSHRFIKGSILALSSCWLLLYFTVALYLE